MVGGRCGAGKCSAVEGRAGDVLEVEERAVRDLERQIAKRESARVTGDDAAGGLEIEVVEG